MTARIRATIGQLPANLQATFLILAAFLAISAQSVLTRYSAEMLPPNQVVFLRQACAMLVFAPVYWRARHQIIHPNRIELHLLRGSLGVVLNLCTFYALLFLPLADVTSIGLSEVLFVTVFAALILREQVGLRRWLATLIGFVGVGVMLGPLKGGLNVYALLPLLSALCSAVSGIALRMTAGKDRLETVLFWQGGTMAVLLFPIALLNWQPVSAADMLLIVPMAVLLVGSQTLFGAAMRLGEVSALAPMHYVRLAIMAALGFGLYGEVPSLQTMLGGLIIVGTASYTIRRNAVRVEAECSSKA
jgi:drug/metabolite transporter (DMT)-like permease